MTANRMEGIGGGSRASITPSQGGGFGNTSYKAPSSTYSAAAATDAVRNKLSNFAFNRSNSAGSAGLLSHAESKYNVGGFGSDQPQGTFRPSAPSAPPTISSTHNNNNNSQYYNPRSSSLGSLGGSSSGASKWGITTPTSPSSSTSPSNNTAPSTSSPSFSSQAATSPSVANTHVSPPSSASSAPPAPSSSLDVERRLVDEITTPAGVRAAPPRDALASFVTRAKTLDLIGLSQLLDEKLSADSWQARLRALHVIEALLKSRDTQSQVLVYFSGHSSALESLSSSSPQASVRERATKVVRLVFRDQNPPQAAAPAVQQQQQHNSAPQSTPEPTAQPPTPSGGGMFSGLSMGAPTSPSATSPSTKAPVPVAAAGTGTGAGATGSLIDVDSSEPSNGDDDFDPLKNSTLMMNMMMAQHQQQQMPQGQFHAQPMTGMPAQNGMMMMSGGGVPQQQLQHHHHQQQQQQPNGSQNAAPQQGASGFGFMAKPKDDFDFVQGLLK